MRTAIIVSSLFLMGFLGLPGCSEHRASSVAAEPALPEGGGVSGDERFMINTPSLGTMIKQGETQSVTIRLDRGDNFKQNVMLEIRPDMGLRIKPARTTVKASDLPDVNLLITAPRDAALGQYKIYLKGTPELGEATSTDFTVTVVAP